MFIFSLLLATIDPCIHNYSSHFKLDIHQINTHRYTTNKKQNNNNKKQKTVGGGGWGLFQLPLTNHCNLLPFTPEAVQNVATVKLTLATKFYLDWRFLARVNGKNWGKDHWPLTFYIPWYTKMFLFSFVTHLPNFKLIGKS